MSVVGGGLGKGGGRFALASFAPRMSHSWLLMLTLIFRCRVGMEEICPRSRWFSA